MSGYKAIARRFIGKVLQDGHLSLPEDAAKEVGSVFEVVLIPIEEPDIYGYAESIAKEKGFSDLTEQDIDRIIHESTLPYQPFSGKGIPG